MTKREYIILAILLLLYGYVSFEVGLTFYQNEDVNHDGKINAKDVLIVQKYILENKEE